MGIVYIDMIHVIEPIDPEIIVGIEEFEECIQHSQTLGQWDAWKTIYFERFRGAFQPMLDVVYQDTLDSLRPYVEEMDFEAALENAQSFIKADGVNRVRQALNRAMEALPPSKPFPVYLLVGIGHANGMALPAQEPYMFIGMERAKCQDGIDGLIAHEYNHLYRVQRFYRGFGPASLTVGDFTIAEGLATVFPLVLLDQEISATRISECLPALGDPKSVIAREPEMRAEILAHWNQLATREMIARFIECGVAYFVGGVMIANLLDQGFDICALTRMPTERLSELLWSSA